jgi:malate dehydrogenase (oxaloacetate-decarboxylating)(NADP+)
MKRGLDVLRDKTLNRSITFRPKERDRLGLRGLLPHRVSTEEQMMERVMVNLERMPRDIDRYMQLSALQERNERLFYRTVIEHIDRIMPLIYTPTVGEACREFSHIAREPKGFFITPDDRGQIRRMLGNWPHKDIRVISSPMASGSWVWAISARTAWGSRSASSPCTRRAPGSRPRRVCR